MTVYGVTGGSGALGRLTVRELLARGVAAHYGDPQAQTAALAGVDRLLLVSSSEAGRRVAHHTNVIEAAEKTGVSRIVYTSMLNADDSTNPLAGEHRDTEAILRAAAVPFVSLRNGWYTENYTDQLGAYLERGELFVRQRTNGGLRREWHLRLSNFQWRHPMRSLRLWR